MKLFSCCGCVLALSLFYGLTNYRVAHAQNEHLPTYKPQLSALLERADKALTAGTQSARARTFLVSVQCLNGDVAAASAQVAKLDSPASRARTWAKLGYFQQKHQNDSTSANASFNASKREAALIKSSVSDKESQLRELGRLQASSGDTVGAIETTEGFSPWSRFDALSDVARIAARDGNFDPALKLVALAKDAEEKSLANSLLCIAHAQAYNWQAALDAFQQVSLPEHKVPALLALFENQKLKEGEKDPFLSQALALVPLIQNDEDAIDLSGVKRDADYGAIALAQLDNHDHPDIHKAAARGLEILRLVKSGENAQDFALKMAAILADEDLPKAQEIIAWRAGDVATIGAVVKVLGREWAWKGRTEAEKTTLSAQMSQLINMAVDKVRVLDGSDRGWALADTAKMTAQAHDFKTAKVLADQIETPRRKAYGFAGMAQAAIEQDDAERVQWSLELMEKAAGEEPDVNERGEIIAQCVQSLLEPLLEEEPPSFAVSVAGLN